jgi:hypothetical protein
MPDPLTCSSCHTPMDARSFERKLFGSEEINLCYACQAIWFDRAESMQLAPRSVVELFTLINQQRTGLHPPLASRLACPRCQTTLLRTVDRVRASTFIYFRCANDHGHFITFAQFMTEKGFVRQLSIAEIRKISEYVRTVRCPGCGAPIDIRKDNACSYCHAPIAILDPKAVETALATYQQVVPAATPSPDQLAGVILASAQERGAGAPGTQVGDLVLDGAGLIAHLLSHL